MKKNILLIISLFTINIVVCQNVISLSYNGTGSGRNFILDYSRLIKSNFEFGAGIRINKNRITQPDDENNVFYKRLYATNAWQHFGIHGFFHWYFLTKLPHIQPFLFYDIQMTKSTTRTSMYLPTGYSSTGETVYIYKVEYFGPFIWIDQNIGLGFKVKIFNSLYLFEKLGVGVSFILGYDYQLPITYDKFEWDFEYLLSTGILYHFAKNKK